LLFCVLGAAIATAGIVIFVIFLFGGLKDMTGGLVRVVVPGSSEIELRDTGRHTVFYEYKSVIDGKVYNTRGNMAGLTCSLNSKETGEEVPVSAASTNTTYSLGNRAGYSILEFDINKPGAYEFSARYQEGTDGPEVVLSIGHNVIGRLLVTIFGSIAILLGSWIIGAVIIVVTLVKRQQRRKRVALEYS
jgi:hypothetical protein